VVDRSPRIRLGCIAGKAPPGPVSIALMPAGLSASAYPIMINMAYQAWSIHFVAIAVLDPSDVPISVVV
jgi:hypothetical protein